MTPPRRTSAPLLFDSDLEGTVLGAMLHWEQAYQAAVEKLTELDFYDQRHRHLFRVMRELKADIEPTRVMHRARVEWPGASVGEAGALIHALFAGCTTQSAGLAQIEDLVGLRDRRHAVEAAELIQQAAVTESPDTVLRLARSLVAEEPSRNGYERITAAWLLEQEFPDPVWIIPQWLSEGLCMFAGRPKVRKSFLMLQLCMAKATGGVFLGRRLQPAPVVYFALEDGKPRLAKRLRDLQCPRGVDDLHFQVSLPPLDQGAVEHVEAYVEATGAKLVVIDTLEAAMVGVRRNKDHDVNAHLTEKLRPFQRLALDRHITIVFVDHLRKPGLSKRSLINDVMGGTAKVGVADTIWGMWREDGETKGELQMKGREVEELSHLLEWKATPLAWQYVGDLEEATMSEAERRYLDAVRELGPEVDSRAISDYLSVTPQAAQEMLRKLREGGRLAMEVKTTAKGGRTFLYSTPSRSPLVAPAVVEETWLGQWWEERPDD